MWQRRRTTTQSSSFKRDQNLRSCAMSKRKLDAVDGELDEQNSAKAAKKGAGRPKETGKKQIAFATLLKTVPTLTAFFSAAPKPRSQEQEDEDDAAAVADAEFEETFGVPRVAFDSSERKAVPAAVPAAVKAAVVAEFKTAAAAPTVETKSPKRNFNETWLNNRPWLSFVPGQGMFCSVCKESSGVWGSAPCGTLTGRAVRAHGISQAHLKLLLSGSEVNCTVPPLLKDSDQKLFMAWCACFQLLYFQAQKQVQQVQPSTRFCLDCLSLLSVGQPSVWRSARVGRARHRLGHLLPADEAGERAVHFVPIHRGESALRSLRSHGVA
jgi:hypothetical protein